MARAPLEFGAQLGSEQPGGSEIHSQVRKMINAASWS